VTAEEGREICFCRRVVGFYSQRSERDGDGPARRRRLPTSRWSGGDGRRCAKRRACGSKGAGRLTGGVRPILNFQRIFKLSKLCSAICLPSSDPKFSKLCKVTDLSTRNNFTFWLNFKFPLYFELKILEKIPI
jgi:hypothetical protein